VPAQVHRHGDHVLTFWRYQAHDPIAVLDEAAAARALEVVHRALDTYRRPLPSFLSRQVRRAGRLLEDPGALPALPAPERALLAAEHARLTAVLADRAMDYRSLHGDPHRGNFLVVPGGCLMIDFESVCSGPVEWDLSALPEAAAELFDADAALLEMLRRPRSVCAATWCAARRRPGARPVGDVRPRSIRPPGATWTGCAGRRRSPHDCEVGVWRSRSIAAVARVWA
jgi:hypothetical protein